MPDFWPSGQLLFRDRRLTLCSDVSTRLYKTHSTSRITPGPSSTSCPTSQAPGVGHQGDTVMHHRSGAFLFALLTASFGFVGCAGLVAGNNGNPPPTTLAITNVVLGPATTSSCQLDWTTNIPADSAVDYGTSTLYGASTPVDPTMVTSHQVVLSGLAPGTVYYYQLRSTDSKSNNARSSGHSFKTSSGGPSITTQPARRSRQARQPPSARPPRALPRSVISGGKTARRSLVQLRPAIRRP